MSGLTLEGPAQEPQELCHQLGSPLYDVIQRSVVTESGPPRHPLDLGSDPSVHLDLQSSAFVKEHVVVSKPHISREGGACSPCCGAAHLPVC